MSLDKFLIEGYNEFRKKGYLTDQIIMVKIDADLF
jgi:hypothetical protein